LLADQELDTVFEKSIVCQRYDRPGFKIIVLVLKKAASIASPLAGHYHRLVLQQRHVDIGDKVTGKKTETAIPPS